MGRDPLHLVSEVQSVDLETAYPKPRYQTKQAKQAAVMEEQIAALANAVNDGRVANEARLDAIWQSLELWRPAVTHLQHQVNELRTQVGRIALHPALAAPLDPIPEGDAVVRPVPAATTDATEHHGPLGHGEIDNTGGQAYGVVTTQLPPPVKGTSLTTNLLPVLDVAQHRCELESRTTHHSSLNWSLPKLDFPTFDGDNPQFWKMCCEKYFDVYGISTELWVRVATLHFTGNAASWLQLHESQSASMSWGELCAALCGKFGREQYQAHLRQFRTLRQTGTVQVYMSQFEEIMHQLLAHNPSFDPVFFTTQFLEGLKHEIRMGVVLHQPKDLDSTFSLASMQEELMDALPRREYRRQDAPQARPAPRPLLALGAQVPRQPPPRAPVAADDRRGLDAANAPERGRAADDRVAVLHNYRRA